mgnify:CR=1 FL=1
MDSSATMAPINIMCSCHQTERMQVAYPQHGIETIARRHGTYHASSLGVTQLLQIIAGTTEGSAILRFVQQAVGT